MARSERKMFKRDDLKNLKLLGNKNTKYKFQYDKTVLEKFGNKHPEMNYTVNLNCFEFTTVSYATADIKNNLSKSCAHRNFDKTCIFNVTC